MSVRKDLGWRKLGRLPSFEALTKNLDTEKGKRDLVDMLTFASGGNAIRWTVNTSPKVEKT